MENYISVHIRTPVWMDRSISINKNIVKTAFSTDKALLVTIGAKPYNKYKYYIDPKTVIDYGNLWRRKGATLLNFPISLMKVLRMKNV